MALSKYAFIVKGAALCPENNTVNTASPLFNARFIGVESVDQACECAGRLAEEGVQLIELCGGFDEAATKRVSDAAGGAIPVCASVINDVERAKLGAILSAAE